MPRRPTCRSLAIICLLLGLLLYLGYREHCRQLFPTLVVQDEPGRVSKSPQGSVVEPAVVSNLTCFVNREVSRNVGLSASRRYPCKRDQSDIYVPFAMVKSYFETSGDWAPGKQGREFDISLSYSKVYVPKSHYDPWGPFLHFHTFDVESRSRVKCISASAGVPVSTQWNQEGYYYPTQIAQYALAHYSIHTAHRNGTGQRVFLDEQLRQEESLSDGDGGGGEYQRIWDAEAGAEVVHFKQPMAAVRLKAPASTLVLSISIKNIEAAGLEVTLLYAGEEFTLRYTNSTQYLLVKRKEFTFGFGSRATGSSWLRLTRDLAVDLKKGLAATKSGRRPRRASMRVAALRLLGEGLAANVSLAEEEHLQMFFHAADWFLENQDANGGWPSHVVFNEGRKKYPHAEEIPPGWYGAMCQGQAISVLCRAFHISKNPKYLTAARAAIGVFLKSSQEGGVVAEFLGSLPWYEEYPTSPPTFILNGFIYSLLGLYDLSTLDPKNAKAEKLFNSGLESLKTMLPFYDSGSGTFYDLRHFTMKTSPKISRWDYHATHVNQLYVLATITSSSQLRETADRWRGYMVGKRAPHN